MQPGPFAVGVPGERGGLQGCVHNDGEGRGRMGPPVQWLPLLIVQLAF